MLIKGYEYSIFIVIALSDLTRHIQGSVQVSAAHYCIVTFTSEKRLHRGETFGRDEVIDFSRRSPDSHVVEQCHLGIQEAA